MSSTSSPPFSIVITPRDRHTRVLKNHIVVHTLILSTAVFLLMQLTWHMTAVEEVEGFDMPPDWRGMFVRQFVEGTKVFSWVVVFLLVPLDVLHALLCIGWYADELHLVQRRRDSGKRRRAAKGWLDGIQQSLKAWRQEHLGSSKSRDGEKDSQDNAHDAEHQPTQRQPTSHNRTSSHRMNDSDIIPSPPSPLNPHTYHPLLQPTYTPLTRHILLVLWDTLMLLTLSSHIFVYTSNIRPGLAFCATHDYPLWHFNPTSSTLKLTLQERCQRINWSIRSAGAFSATGAVVLAAWHLCDLIGRVWNVVDEELVDRMRGGRLGRLKTKLRIGRNMDAGVGVGMLDWQHPPRDVDVKSRSTMKRSARSDTCTGTEDASRCLPTVGQEELDVGMGRRRRKRRRRREGKSDASSSNDREKEVRGSRWEGWRSEGFLECLA